MWMWIPFKEHDLDRSGTGMVITDTFNCLATVELSIIQYIIGAFDTITLRTPQTLIILVSLCELPSEKKLTGFGLVNDE
jgi:hypothetical protein